MSKVEGTMQSEGVIVKLVGVEYQHRNTCSYMKRYAEISLVLLMKLLKVNRTVQNSFKKVKLY